MNENFSGKRPETKARTKEEGSTVNSSTGTYNFNGVMKKSTVFFVFLC